MSGSTPTPHVTGPFQGLGPFREQDSRFFFGRETEKQIVCANLLGSRLTILYAASGVGKSSLLYAGVSSALRLVARQNLADHGRPGLAVVAIDRWQEPPLDRLLEAMGRAVAAALGSAIEPVALGARLANSLRSLSDQLNGDILILLDQFEDYFLYHAADDGPGSFAAELASAVNAPGLRANFLISIRDDSLARLDRFRGLIPTLFDNLLRLDHLDRSAASQAIYEPVAAYSSASGISYQVEPSLVAAVLDGVAVGQVALGDAGKGLLADGSRDQRIESPYLQLVMSRLWDEELHGGSHTLRRKTLEVLGDVERIVQQHLDSKLDGLPVADQETAAHALRYLVTPSGTKIALGIEDLVQFTGESRERLAAVLQTLSDPAVRILLPVAGQRYQIFHDVLAEPALDWRRRFAVRRERAEAKQRFARERRRVRWLRIGVAALSLLLAATGVLAWWGERQKRRADVQARLAAAGKLAAAATYIAESNLDLALLLGVQAHRTADTFDTRNALLQVVQSKSRVRAFLWAELSSVEAVSFSRDGTLLAAGDNDGALQIWDVAQRRPLGHPVTLFTGKFAPINAIAFSPDGSTLAAGSLGGEVRTLDVKKLQLAGEFLNAKAGAVFALAYSQDGGVLAVAYDKVPVALCDPTTSPMRARSLPESTTSADSLAFSSDGDTLLISVGTELSAWTIKSQPPEKRTLDVYSGQLTTNARFVVLDNISLRGDPHTLRVGDVQGQREVFVTQVGDSSEVVAKALTGDASFLVAADDDGILSFWNLKEPAPPEHFDTGIDLTQLAMSPDGTTLAVVGVPHTIEAAERTPSMLMLLDLQERPPLLKHYTVAFREVQELAPSPDSHYLAVSGGDLGLNVLDLQRGWPALHSLDRRDEGAWHLQFTAGSQSLMVGDRHGQEFLWKLDERGPPSLLFTDPNHGNRAAAFSPSGKAVAYAYPDLARTVTEWDLGPFRRVQTFTLPQADVLVSVAFSPDGRRLVVGDRKRELYMWDLDAHRLACKPHVESTDLDTPVLAFTLDGSLLGVGTAHDTVVFVDVKRCLPLPHPLTGHGASITGLSFSPDSKTLASSSLDRSVRLWDVASREPLFGPLLQPKKLEAVAFGASGEEVFSASEDSVYRWDVSTTSWEQRACRRAGRNLSVAEWRQLISPDRPYERTCPDLPPGQ